MREVMRRRFSGANLRDWPKPDLILIDGGRGQLEAAQGVLRELGVTVPSIGLAKRLEEIIQQPEPGRFTSIVLPPSSHVLQLLQRVRDESHRFAITYQTVLRGKRATASVLDSIPGVGPATRTRLVKRFGSVHGVRAATAEELTAAVGAAKARVIRAALGDTSLAPSVPLAAPPATAPPATAPPATAPPATASSAT